MKIQATAVLHGIKESKGEYEGRAFSSCAFHIETDLASNGAGRSLGRVTRPFKMPDASIFDQWSHLAGSFPVNVACEFELSAGKGDESNLKLVAIKPVSRVAAAVQQQQATPRA